MEFSWLDFIIGLFLANSIPHFVVGVMDIRFFSLFGFGSKQNLLYSAWNLGLALGLSLYFHGLDHLLNNAFFWGVFFVLTAYAAVGRYLYLRWRK